MELRSELFVVVMAWACHGARFLQLLLGGKPHGVFMCRPYNYTGAH